MGKFPGKSRALAVIQLADNPFPTDSISCKRFIHWNRCRQILVSCRKQIRPNLEKIRFKYNGQHSTMPGRTIAWRPETLLGCNAHLLPSIKTQSSVLFECKRVIPLLATLPCKLVSVLANFLDISHLFLPKIRLGICQARKTWFCLLRAFKAVSERYPLCAGGNSIHSTPEIIVSRCQVGDLSWEEHEIIFPLIFVDAAMVQTYLCPRRPITAPCIALKKPPLALQLEMKHMWPPPLNTAEPSWLQMPCPSLWYFFSPQRFSLSPHRSHFFPRHPCLFLDLSN